MRTKSWGRRLLVALGWILGIVMLLAGAATLWALVDYRRTFDVPIPGVKASTDPAVIERGRYIVYGPGRCADCHTPDVDRPRLFHGEEAPLTGGAGEHTYLGTWNAPNLTPDMATGLGAVTDGQLARMLRYGVNREGRTALPFMDAYANLADDDMVAIISYLRSVPPASGAAPAQRINLLGKITLTYFLTPYAPAAPPPAHLTPEPTAAYGEYVAKTLAGCGACHTARNLETGEYLSPLFSGGLQFHSRLHPASMYVSPNLTPDRGTGVLANWSEDRFVQRFREGLFIEDSPMPWGGFMRMTDTDLRAVYQYLHTLAPVPHDVGPTTQPLHGQAAGG